MKIEELAEKMYANKKKPFHHVTFGSDCMRVGLKVALVLIRKYLEDSSTSCGEVGYETKREIQAILEGRAELPEVEG